MPARWHHSMEEETQAALQRKAGVNTGQKRNFRQVLMALPRKRKVTCSMTRVLSRLKSAGLLHSNEWLLAMQKPAGLHQI